MNHAHLRRAFDQKVRAGIFRNVGSFLPPWVREDRVQDAICRTWVGFVRYAERGKLLTDGQLVRLCHWKVIDRRHRGFADMSLMPKYDIMNERNHERFALVPVDEAPDDAWWNLRAETQTALATGDEETMMEIVDLRRWFRSLTPRDRTLVHLRAVGHTLAEITRRTRTDSVRVRSRLDTLGDEMLIWMNEM